MSRSRRYRRSRSEHWLLCAAAAAVVYVSATAGLLWWSTVPVVAGWQPTVVLTGSMAPSLRPGDVVLVGPADATVDSLPKGRIVLVADRTRDTGTYLHRVDRWEDEGALVTRGDANATADAPVSADRVLGEVRLVVPLVGLPAVWLRDGAALPLVALIAVTGAAVTALLRLRAVRAGAAVGPRHVATTSRASRRRSRSTVVAGTAMTAAVALVAPAGHLPTTVAPWTATAVAASSFTARAVVGTAPVDAYRNAVAADSPLSSWPLDETTGTVAVDRIGGRNGVYANAPTLDRPGAVTGQTGRSVLFDGVDDYVDLGDVYDFPGTAAFSVELWVNPGPTWQRWPRLVSKERFTDENDRGGWTLIGHDPSFGLGHRLSFERYAGSAKDLVVTSRPLPVGVWTHVVATYDGATMQIYLDGVRSGRAPSSLSLENSTTKFTIGASGDDYFPGGLDEVTVYGTALSPEQVLAHYNAGRA